MPDSNPGVPGQESKTNTVPDEVLVVADVGRARTRVVRLRHPLSMDGAGAQSGFKLHSWH